MDIIASLNFASDTMEIFREELLSVNLRLIYWKLVASTFCCNFTESNYSAPSLDETFLVLLQRSLMQSSGRQ